jgi:GDPmannose 4,6-dehydratase
MSLLAIISGITGQDGSYLAELLHDKGYTIYGLVRRSSISKLDRLCPTLVQSPRLILKDVDMTDTTSIYLLLKDIKEKHEFDRLEIYNLAAQSHVGTSFEMPEYTTNVDALGPLRFLDAIRVLSLKDRVRFYQAGTSELFGKVQCIPQTETTPFYPRSPYGCAKLFGFWITKNYREGYGLYACNGILFNHESERRGDDFVTRKITKGIAKISRGEQSHIELGNLDASRDWGHALDYVYGMWLMLQQDTPDDYVLSTGSTHSVREFVESAFEVAGIPIVWQGSGVDESGVNAETGELLVKINPVFYRPTEVDMLVGDSSKAKEKLGWVPTISFKELVRKMVEHDRGGLAPLRR